MLTTVQPTIRIIKVLPKGFITSYADVDKFHIIGRINSLNQITEILLTSGSGFNLTIGNSDLDTDGRLVFNNIDTRFGNTRFDVYYTPEASDLDSGRVSSEKLGSYLVNRIEDLNSISL